MKNNKDKDNNDFLAKVYNKYIQLEQERKERYKKKSIIDYIFSPDSLASSIICIILSVAFFGYIFYRNITFYNIITPGFILINCFYAMVMNRLYSRFSMKSAHIVFYFNIVTAIAGIILFFKDVQK